MFFRYYSSRNGQWKHNFSDRLHHYGNFISIVSQNGRVSRFMEDNGLYVPLKPGSGQLRKDKNSWLYTSIDKTEQQFDMRGNISSIRRAGNLISIKQEGSSLVITDAYGATLSIDQGTDGRFHVITFGDIKAHYKYNPRGQLIEVTVVTPDGEYKQGYLYEDSRDPRLLTAAYRNGILEHRWTYDEHARAISSQSISTDKKVFLSYEENGGVTLTHESGLEQVYRYQEAADSSFSSFVKDYYPYGCVTLGQQYEYNASGLLVSSRDNNGNLASFSYSPEQLEISRTEARGSSVERTIYKTWTNNLGLPKSLTNSGQTINYEYNKNGQVIRKSIVDEGAVN